MDSLPLFFNLSHHDFVMYVFTGVGRGLHISGIKDCSSVPEVERGAAVWERCSSVCYSYDCDSCFWPPGLPLYGLCAKSEVSGQHADRHVLQRLVSRLLFIHPCFFGHHGFLVSAKCKLKLRLKIALKEFCICVWNAQNVLGDCMKDRVVSWLKSLWPHDQEAVVDLCLT